jgi:hypothetical protein
MRPAVDALAAERPERGSKADCDLAEALDAELGGELTTGANDMLVVIYRTARSYRLLVPQDGNRNPGEACEVDRPTPLH